MKGVSKNMALINCPECGKEISDKSEVCIHCGFPLINTKCNINGVIYDFKEELPIALLEKVEDYIPAVGKIQLRTSLTFADADRLVDIIRETKSIPPSFTPKYPLENRKELYGETDVRCPYCKSKNTKKISNTSKALHTALFGVFSVSRNSKEFHCNNCNSDF